MKTPGGILRRPPDSSGVAVITLGYYEDSHSQVTARLRRLMTHRRAETALGGSKRRLLRLALG